MIRLFVYVTTSIVLLGCENKNAQYLVFENEYYIFSYPNSYEVVEEQAELQRSLNSNVYLLDAKGDFIFSVSYSIRGKGWSKLLSYIPTFKACENGVVIDSGIEVHFLGKKINAELCKYDSLKLLSFGHYNEYGSYSVVINPDYEEYKAILESFEFNKLQ